MKTTFRIARLELNTLFYSPIAWFLSIVFLFQCGLAYTNNLQQLLTYQQIGGFQLRFLNNATFQVFGTHGLFGDVLRKAYLYLPLMTMGLISREVNSGTIKLLLSSPVKISSIVFGKFVAMMAYNLVLVGILILFGVTGLFNIQSANTGFIFPGIFSIYLLLCTYAAIGLFMSCLTSYQVVAAISTLVVFAVLAYVGSVWQSIDFVRDLTYFLSITGRAERMIYGLLSTNHILYFLIIIALFLAFSIIKLQSGRKTIPRLRLTARYVTAFVLALLVGYVTSRPGLIGYYDATEGHIQTITPAAQQVVKSLGNEPLEVTSYINLVDNLYRVGQPDQRNQDVDRWEGYLRFKPNIKLHYVYYYDTPSENQELFKQYPGKSLEQIASQIAYSYKTDLSDFKTPAEIRKIIDLRGEQHRYVMELRFKGKTTFLRLFDDNEVFPGEAEISAALKRLTVQLPKIVFVQGEYERNVEKLGDKNYGELFSHVTNRFALVNQGFDSDTVSLERQDIPAGIAVLVIADPKTAFSANALRKLQQYIDAGGNLLIAGEPGRQDILAPLLQPLGVQLMDGMLVQQSKNDAPDLVRALLTPMSAGFSKALASDSKDSAGVTMPGATGLRYHVQGGFTVTPLLVTDSATSWLKKGKLVPDSADLAFSPADGDEKGTIPTALALTREVNGRHQRIVVAGDADFLSSAELKRYTGANADFDTPLFGWFTYGQFPINTERPDAKDNHINLTYPQLSAMRLFFLGILPGVWIVAALVFLIRRKRK